MDSYPYSVKFLAVFLSLLFAQGPIITGHRSTRAHGTAGPNLGNSITAGYANSSRILACNTGFATTGISQNSTGGSFTVSSFGFAIPVGATIAGISVSIQHEDITGNGGVKDSVVQLIKGGVTVGSNKASASIWDAGFPETFSYGGIADLWGAAWLPSDINASNFGLKFVGNNTDAIDGMATIGIACVQITVTY